MDTSTINKKYPEVFKEKDGTQYKIQTTVQMVLVLSKSGNSKY